MKLDPLGLMNTATPESIRQDRAAPLSAICHLNNRLISNQCADSLETKVTILAHMLFLIYNDLKEHTTP